MRNIYAACLLFAISIARLAGQEAAIFLSGEYAVKAGLLTNRASDPIALLKQAKHEEIWRAFKALVPRRLLGQISNFRVYSSEPVNEHGDFHDAMYAYRGADSFELGIKLKFAYPAFVARESEARRQMEATIIHYLGHMIAAMDGQTEARGSAAGGFVADAVPGNLNINEVNLKSDAWLSRFYRLYWEPRFPGLGLATFTRESADGIYKDAPDAFVDPTAAIGPEEDFAETFAAFVTGEKPANAGIATQKILFFYSRAELADMRDEIRKALSAAQAAR